MKKHLHVLLLTVLAVFLLCAKPLLAEPPMAPPDEDTKAASKTSTAKKNTTKKTAKTEAKKTAKADGNATETSKTAAAAAKKSSKTSKSRAESNATEPAAQPDQAAKTPEAEAKTDAVAKKTVKAAPEASPKAKSGEDYEKFLEKYGAWDRLDKVYTGSDDPDVVMKRVTMALQSGAPQQALEILESSPSFEDKDKELQRLWLGGQAARAAGDPSKAVFWFSQAGQLLSDKERNARFREEPGLETLWTDVWRRFFWIYAANFGATREGQESVLRTTLAQAQEVWKNNPFWDAAAKAMENDSAPAGTTMAGEGIELGEDDRLLLAKALAAACLNYPEAAKAAVDALSADAPRAFWQNVVGMVSEGADPAEDQTGSAYPKAKVFWGSNVMSRSASGRTDWVLAEDPHPEWQELRQKKRSLSDAAKRVVGHDAGKELEALPVFNQYRFALAVAEGKIDQAQLLWPGLEKKDLPLSLKVCGLLLFNQPVAELLPEDPNAAARQYALLPTLTSAGGGDAQSPQLAPFWTRLEGRQLTTAASRTWPLDRLLVLADWTARFEEKPSPELAKRIAFLFPDTETGALATLQLATEAMSQQQYQLAGFYLANVETTRLPRQLKARQLELKGDLAFSLSNFDEALTLYSDLLKTGVELSNTSRIRVAFILQQKGQLDVAQGQLEKLWEHHQDMPPSMQAEVLYYLGEGAHAMGNTDKALDYYLRLAWQYPQENIWALTAMFRAALIYDNMGQYDTAKNLLVTVIRNAETEQQREAAKNRLAEIEAKIGHVEDRPKSGGSVVYPF